MKNRINNVISINKNNAVKSQINVLVKDLIEDNEILNISNCAIVLIDNNGDMIYSYANLNKSVTMIGALEILKLKFAYNSELEE